MSAPLPPAHSQSVMCKACTSLSSFEFMIRWVDRNICCRNDLQISLRTSTNSRRRDLRRRLRCLPIYAYVSKNKNMYILNYPVKDAYPDYGSIRLNTAGVRWLICLQDWIKQPAFEYNPDYSKALHVDALQWEEKYPLTNHTDNTRGAPFKSKCV